MAVAGMLGPWRLRSTIVIQYMITRNVYDYQTQIEDRGHTIYSTLVSWCTSSYSKMSRVMPYSAAMRCDRPQTRYAGAEMVESILTPS